MSNPMALAALALSMLLSSLGTSIVNVALPTLAQVLEASFHQVQWIVLAYLLAITAVIVVVGRLGDLVGRRRLLLAGILVFTLASVACGAAPTLGMLLAARVAQGVGAAIMMALTLAFVGEAVPKARIGSAMGLLGTMSAVGTALGPSLGGVLVALFGWPAIFYLNAPLGLVAYALAQRHLPPDPAGPKDASATPLLPRAMLRDPVVGAGFAMSILATSVVMATLVVGPFYLSGALALDAARVGLVMSCGPIVAALAGVPAGRMVDRLGARPMAVAGLAAMAAGASLLALVPLRSGVPGYLAPLVVVTAGYALFQAANNTAVMATARPDQRGVVSGVLNLARNLGLVTGASLMGAVFALGAATTDLTAAGPAAVAAGMHATFAVAALVILAALAIAAASDRSRFGGESAPTWGAGPRQGEENR